MNDLEKNTTCVIVSFQSDFIIEKCINSINSKVKIIVVENSNDHSLKNKLEDKFPNVEVFLPEQNLGYGAGNNLGISKVKTKYAFILNPDCFLDKNCFSELHKAQVLLQDNFVILAPNNNTNYGYYQKKKIIEYKGYHSISQFSKIIEAKKSDQIFEVDYVIGFAMLINLKKIFFNKIFDENFFLFCEETDLCKRIKDLGEKIFVVSNAKATHLARQSSEYNLNIEMCKNWHWMWSLFYYNKKHYGILTAYKKTLYRFFSSIFKFVFHLIFFRRRRFLIYFYRIFGLLNAYTGKSSWLRPFKKNLLKFNEINF